MEAVWVFSAFFLGFLAQRLGLPPLVGYLGAGFGLSFLGVKTSPFLHQVAETGVLLLLYTVGLKLRVRSLLDRAVYGVGGLHLLFFFGLALLFLQVSPALALALGFSSTVLVVKILEDKRELLAFHGRLAVGILVLQDLVAVGLLSLTDRPPSPWALLLLLLPLLRPLVRYFLGKSGHEELLLLFGLAMAFLGAEAFRSVGLSPELGALAMGVLLADDERGSELGKLLWGIKEAFLVAFFLEVGLRQGLEGLSPALIGLGLLLLLPKGALFFALFLLFGLRARTAFLGSLYLTNYSEFALIVAAGLSQRGAIPEGLLPNLALLVALSMALSAPLARLGHGLYARLEPWLVRLERKERHPDEEPKSLGAADWLIVGMGRTGGAAYKFLERAGARPVGLDADPAKLERHRAKGRRVLYGDAEDPELWEQLRTEGLKGVILALPDLEAKLRAVQGLRRRGYRGLIAATSFHLEEDPVLEAAGADLLFHPFAEAGERLAERALEAIMGRYGRSQQVGPD
ncbi:cation:proton antiporter family protein [Thermus filiformis]|uniref:Potassium transporter KefC n=1 Tax=Thermus filiformis TaxID=276 RepID=A0A0A2WMJ2_THEFI|nr:cation:proton antiporter family protein [Thermus filiformis]KGQ21401.1 potassium transporter KefC [Thermus filiformis]